MAKSYSLETKRDAKNLVIDSISRFESQRQDIRDGWVKLDKAYRAIYDETQQAYLGTSRYTTPILQDNTETILARMMESVTITEKTLDISPERTKPNYQDNKIKAEIYTQIAAKQTEQQEINLKKEILGRMGLKYGTAICKVPWVKETDMQKERKVFNDPILDEDGNQVIDANGQPMFDEPRTEEVETEITKYIGPGYEVITDLEDIYVDMFIQDIQDQPIVIHRMLVDEKFLNDQVKAGNYYKDMVEKISKSPMTRSTDSTTGTTKSEEILGQSRMTDVDGLQKEYELFEAWAMFDIDGSGEEKSCVITVVNDELIGLRLNPFWHQEYPFLAWKYIEVEGEFYGISAYDAVLGLYYDYNDTLNQMNDAAAFVLNPIIIEFIGNAKNKQSLKVMPGAVWEERVQGALRVLGQDVGNILAAEQRLAAMERRINQGMGITPLIQGGGDTGDLDKTWRGTQKVINQADKKFKMRSRRFEKELYEKWLEMGLPMNAQLLDEKFLFTQGQDAQGNPIQTEVEIQDAVGEFNFNVVGVEHFFDLQDRLDKTMLFSQQSVGKPWINGMALDFQIAEMMGLQDIDQIIVQPPPPAKETKPPNISISLNPKDGTSIAMIVAQILAQAGTPVDINQALDDAEIVRKRTAPANLLQSGMLPDQIEEDIIEDAGKGESTVGEKIKDVTGEARGTKPAQAKVQPNG